MPDLVAIPVFNEAKHVREVVEAVRRFSENILVIDDGSTDGTGELLYEIPGLYVLTHLENRGYGKSIADAFCFARRGGYDWLITMDCDGQHEAASIPRFLAAAREGDADVISGTRYPHGFDVGEGAPADRRAINRRITAMLNHRLGFQLTDAFCGFKAFRVSALDKLCITEPGYAMPMQMWVQVAANGLRVTELDIPLIYNDPNRHFGGQLDDPQVRLRHYLDVFEREFVRRFRQPAAADVPRGCSISTK